MLPSEYFHRQIWISFVDDPIGVKMVGSILDVDKVMFGSDYPHPASTWPHSQQIIEEQCRPLPRCPAKDLPRQRPYAVWNLVDLRQPRGESWRARAPEPKGNVQALAVGITAPGVDRVVADKAQIHCPRLEELVSWFLSCLDIYEHVNNTARS